MVVINGPVRGRCVRCGTGLFGVGNRPTATIGRALGLVVRNALGAVPGGLDQSVFSFPGRYSICFGENEEASPWLPLHAERGLAAGQSAVTVFGSMPMLLVRPSLTAGPEEIIDAAADRLHNSVGVWGGPDRAVDLMMVVAAEHLLTLTAAGWSKADVREALYRALASLRGGPTRDRDTVLGLRGPDHILVVAAGGSGNPLSMLLPPLAGGAVTVAVADGAEAPGDGSPAGGVTATEASEGAVPGGAAPAGDTGR